ncbi:MAG: N-6 DNA methylase, partial [Clostridiales bacterium]|nr:N-6 DNA methylase [Clostridiales bacterium]
MEEKQWNALEMEKPSLTMNEVCELLSISRDTAKNWIRLGKMIPDVENQEFSREYMDNFLAEIRSDNNRKLKSRRNKKKAAGKILYKEYIHTEENRELVKDLLELGIIQSENDLRMVLADFAVQLYYQSRGIGYSKGPVLVDFLSQKEFQDFRILVQDLLGPQSLDGDRVNRLLPALEKDIHYVQGEDSLGFVYISLRDIGQRKSTGAYYTPEKVMDELIENLMENLHKTGKERKQRTICDPCCGSGNFLLRLGTQGMDCSRLYGQDMDPVSVYLARINMALADPRLSARDLQSQMIIGNTLFETFDQKFDVILGNPPWGSEFSPEDTWKCRRLFRTAAGTGMEAYDLLIEKALTMLNPTGVLAFVLPEAVLSVSSHAAVRRWLLDSCSFQFVSYLGNVFSGVQCPAIILGVTPDYNPTAVGCKVTMKENTFVITHERTFDDGILSFHVSDEEYECLHEICSRKNTAYLKGNAKFALGIVTGSNREMISE